jgi:hypothetical protein
MGATVMVRSGVSLRAVQTIGWSSLRMLERYAHVNDAELPRAVQVTHAHTDAAIQAPTKAPTAAKTVTSQNGGEVTESKRFVPNGYRDRVQREIPRDRGLNPVSEFDGTGHHPDKRVRQGTLLRRARSDGCRPD